VADVLASKTDGSSKDLLARLSAASAPVKPLVRKHAPDPSIHARGLAVYNRTCIACHGPEGKGVPLAFPPLDGSAWPVGDPVLPIRIVLKGMQGPLEAGGQKFNNVMAPLGVLTDDEIADVLTYVRQSWSNDAPPVSADMVKQVRAKYADRVLPWTADELK
jgi:mono/diheme cytochrome c family protein